MKKKAMVMLLLVLALSMTGCKFELATPESLITPPASNQDKIKQKQIINALLENGECLTVPTEMENPMAYVVADLDQDKSDEMLAFYRNADNAFIQGFMILKQDDQAQWHIIDKITESGSGIDYFQLTDLNNDGVQEVLFGLKSWGSKYLYVYQLNQGVAENLGRIQYDTLILGDLTNGQHQIITVIRDTSEINVSSQINIYSLTGKVISDIYEGDFSGFCNKAVFAKVTQAQQGIYLALLHNQFSSVLLLAEQDGRYQKVLEAPLDYDYTITADIDVFKDINGDGIMEVCYLLPPADSGTTTNISDYMRIWHQWDGQSGLKLVQANLSNPDEGYDFSIPLEWVNRVKYNFRVDNAVEWVDFLYEDEQGVLQKLFSIAAVDQYELDKNAQLKAQAVIMGNNPNKNKVYVATMGVDWPQWFHMTSSQLIACLRVDGGK